VDNGLEERERERDKVFCLQMKSFAEFFTVLYCMNKDCNSLLPFIPRWHVAAYCSLIQLPQPDTTSHTNYRLSYAAAARALPLPPSTVPPPAPAPPRVVKSPGHSRRLRAATSLDTPIEKARACSSASLRLHLTRAPSKRCGEGTHGLMSRVRGEIAAHRPRDPDLLGATSLRHH